MVANDACTSFTVLVDDTSNRPDAVCIGPGRHILFTTKRDVRQKITAVSLLRVGGLVGASAVPAKHGTFNGMTADINEEWYNNYLYIVWKSVLVA